MPMDKIVILALALAFFGGIALLSWKNRRDQNKNPQSPYSSIAEKTEEDSSIKPKENGRKISKS
jgi:hypothetical protein